MLQQKPKVVHPQGAMLIMAWFGDTIRGTRDADLLGKGDMGTAALTRLFQDVCAASVAEDGMRFDPSSVAVRPIRDGDPYGGQRVTMLSRLGSGRIKVQVDVGLGDAVFPEPELLELHPPIHEGVVLGNPEAVRRSQRRQLSVGLVVEGVPPPRGGRVQLA